MPNDNLTPEQIRKETEMVRRFFNGNLTEFKSATESNSGRKTYKSSGELVKERNERLAILKRMKSNGKINEKDFANMVVFVRRRYGDFVEAQTIRETKDKSFENPTNQEDLAAVRNALKKTFNLSDERALSRLMEEHGEDIAVMITGKTVAEAEKIIKSEVTEIKDEVVEAIVEDIKVEDMEAHEAMEAIAEAIEIIGEPQTESQIAELEELKEDKKELEESSEYNIMKRNPENQNWYDRLKEVYYERIKQYDEIISDKTQDPERIKLVEKKKAILESVQIDRVGHMFQLDEHGNSVLKNPEDIANEQNLVMQFFESEYDYKEVTEMGETLDKNDQVYFESADDRINFANMKNMYDNMTSMYSDMHNLQTQMANTSPKLDAKVNNVVASMEMDNDLVMERKPNNSGNHN